LSQIVISVVSFGTFKLKSIFSSFADHLISAVLHYYVLSLWILQVMNGCVYFLIMGLSYIVIFRFCKLKYNVCMKLLPLCTQNKLKVVGR